ncbi:MAG: hypothetical protein LCI00_09740 [Chloroflexi bacterium]|nr:hypothetical protein [Chloroflexota bacterium]MCC6892992.1 hypothetical protein [Anaerolineae bacterium]
MPIQIQWFNDQKRIILWTIQGQWTLQEMHQAYSDGNALCAEVPENIVNALIDMTRSQSIPSNIFSALTARVQTEMPNYDMAVIVSQNVLIKSFVNIFNTIPALREKYIVFKTMDEALAFIEKRRSARAAAR